MPPVTPGGARSWSPSRYGALALGCVGTLMSAETIPMSPAGSWRFSQGLKKLVNIAHALAHHTVAIDRNLPMPGLLVLDGLSANGGHEGFDQAIRIPATTST
jgi:hypothetical protein